MYMTLYSFILNYLIKIQLALFPEVVVDTHIYLRLQTNKRIPGDCDNMLMFWCDLNITMMPKNVL